jgi:hypothetical protein
MARTSHRSLGMRPIVLAVLAAVFAPHSVTAEESTSAETWVDPAPPELRERITDEALALGAGSEPALPGEATLGGDACAAACVSAYVLYCQRVTVLCRWAEVVTIGGATVPCGVAMTAACIGGAGIAAICGRRCPP